MNEDLLVMIVMPIIIFVVVPFLGYVYYIMNKPRFYIVKYKLPQSEHPQYIHRKLVMGHNEEEAIKDFRSIVEQEEYSRPYEVVDVSFQR